MKFSLPSFFRPCRLCDNKILKGTICRDCFEATERAVYEWEAHGTSTTTENPKLDWFIAETIKSRTQ